MKRTRDFAIVTDDTRKALSYYSDGQQCKTVWLTDCIQAGFAQPEVPVHFYTY